MPLEQRGDEADRERDRDRDPERVRVLGRDQDARTRCHLADPPALDVLLERQEGDAEDRHPQREQEPATKERPRMQGSGGSPIDTDAAASMHQQAEARQSEDAGGTEGDGQRNAGHDRGGPGFAVPGMDQRFTEA